MKLHKALKVKNRLVGEINRVKGLIQRDNSKKKKDFDAKSVEANFKEFRAKTTELIELKASIQKATAPIAEKLLEMAELKGQLSWYAMLPTKEGDFEIENYRTETVRTETWKCFFGQADVDARLISIQKRIEELQDEVDEYNATTEI